MTFLGADLSLSKSAISGFKGEGLTYNLSHVPQGHLSKAGRLWDIAEWVLSQYRFVKPDEWAFEAPFVGSGPMMGVALQLAELHGAVKTVLYANSIPTPYYVAPMTLKKFATGDGRAEKSDIKMAILKKWGLEFKSNDEADAYVLARIAGVIAGKIPAQGYELECVKTVLKSPLNAERVAA